MGERPTPGFLTHIRREVERRTGTVEVLDVGGGSWTPVEHPNARHTVIEISRESLVRSAHYAAEQLLGDIQTFDFGSRRFDIVVFWNVLEHVPEPSAALRRAAAVVQPGGLVIVRGPELASLKALVTRLTPHRLHVLFYRHVLGSAAAGQPGRAPFKVEHAAGADRAALASLLESLGLSRDYDERYVGDQVHAVRSFSRAAYRLYKVAEATLRAGSLGRLGIPETEFVIAYRAPGGRRM